MDPQCRSETGPHPVAPDGVATPTGDGRPSPVPAAPASRPWWSTLWVLVVVGLLAGSAGAFATHLYDLAQPTGTSRTVILTPVQTFTGGKMNVATAVATVMPATVIVEATYAPGQLAVAGAGTGIVASADGYVITNAHVISGADTITVIPAGTDRKLTATLIGADTRRVS